MPLPCGIICSAGSWWGGRSDLAEDASAFCAGCGREVAGLFVEGEPGEESESGGFDDLGIPAVIGGGFDTGFWIERVEPSFDAGDQVFVLGAAPGKNDSIERLG